VLPVWEGAVSSTAALTQLVWSVLERGIAWAV